MKMDPAIVRNMVVQLAQVMPAYAVTALKMRREHGLFPVALLDAVACYGDLNVVLTSASFQPAAEVFGDRFRFVGAAIAPRPDESRFDWNKLAGKPLVYISLGTISRSVAFYRMCFEAFADHPGQFILSIGKTNPDTLPAVPNNFTVAAHVPQLEVLQRVNAFVTHGGLNSVHEGLWYGVPMLVAPQQIEQGLVAAQVQQHGAGIALRTAPPFHNLTVAELRAGLERVLADPQMARRAAAVGETLRQAGGAVRAVDEIQQIGKRSR
jgi:MGT family glycosyltransferase